MENIGEFIVNHWLLTTLFIALSLALLLTSIYAKFTGVRAISPAQAVALINQQNGFFLDVREAKVFAKAHIDNAVNVPLSILPDGVAKLKFAGQPVVLVCDMGQSTSPVVQHLRNKGFIDIYLLQGGLNGWREAKLPLFS